MYFTQNTAYSKLCLYLAFSLSNISHSSLLNEYVKLFLIFYN